MEKTKKCNIFKKALALILCVTAFLAVTPAGVSYAEEGEIPATPKIRVTSTSVEAGNYAYVYVEAENFSQIAGLEFSLRYDADVMTPSWCSEGWLISGGTYCVNYDTPGVITLKAANVDGYNGSGTLLSAGFQVSTDATPGTYPITLSVGSVYDENLGGITVDKAAGTVTVLESINDAKQINLFGSFTEQHKKQGDTATYYLYSQDTDGLMAGNFEFTYDPEVLKFTGAMVSEELDTDTCLWSVNSNVSGKVRIAYADIDAINIPEWGHLFYLTFEVLADTDGGTEVDFSSNSLVDHTLGNLKSNNTTAYLYLEKIKPSLQVVESSGVDENNTFQMDVVLSANSGVAAGDFVINYATYEIVCVDVTPINNGGTLVYNEDIGNGSVKFSYINTNPGTTETPLVTMTFQVVNSYLNSTYLYSSASNVVDVNFNNIQLEHQNLMYYIPADINNYYGYVKTEYYDYDGTAKEPEVYIDYLTEGEDYTISYRDNVNAGTATVILTGIGNYRGAKEMTFRIGTANIANKRNMATLSQKNFTYDGTEKEPRVTIPGLVEGTDFIVSYSNNIEQGTATVTVTGIGNYFNSFRKEFQIVNASIEEWDAVLSETKFVYDGTAKMPTVSVPGLVLYTDYVVEYENCINAGTAIVEIHGIKNYSGTIVKEFTIEPADLSGKTAVLSQESYHFNGKEKKPTVSITGLTAGTDFTVSYSNNVNVGTATVIITGRGNYKGTITKEFEIVEGELENPFSDVAEGEFYYEPVLWALKNGITTGLSPTTFGPMKECTRGQVVTFLWRAEGKPAYSTTENPFSDVKSGEFYYDSVLWAAENGVTTGFPGGIFLPDKEVTREQFVTFLWRAAGKPTPTLTANPFPDVVEGEYYYNAVLWAVENNVTTGYPNGNFGTGDFCNRGQVVTFLYRAYK